MFVFSLDQKNVDDHWTTPHRSSRGGGDDDIGGCGWAGLVYMQYGAYQIEHQWICKLESR